MRPFLCLVILAACGDDTTHTTVDAAIDAKIPAGSFDCVGQPRRMTAPDPLRIAGRVLNGSGAALNNVSVEIHRTSDGMLLGSAVTQTDPVMGPMYATNIPTGGVAPETYRKSSMTGLIDTYMFDAFPLFFSLDGPTTSNYSPKEITDYYASVGLAEDPARTSIDLIVLDCPANDGTTHDVADATVTVAGAERVIYLDEHGVPQPGATSTSSSGFVSVFNAPVGALDIKVQAGPYAYRLAGIKTFAGAYTLAYVSP